MNTQPLLKAEQVAKMLNVRPSTVYEWVRMEYIPHIRLGVGEKKSCVRFDAETIQNWLMKKANPGRTTRIPEAQSA